MYPTIDMKATGMRIHRIMNQRKFTVKDVQKYLNLSSVLCRPISPQKWKSFSVPNRAEACIPTVAA